MPNGFDEEEEVVIPGFQGGGIVRETGIALVHEGEYILPEPGSEARIEALGGEASGVVSFYFPVEVTVSGALSDEERDEFEARIWERLGDALDRMR